MVRGLSVLIALGVIGAAAAETLMGRVVSVSDGDTLTLLTADRQRVKIRLAEIDAPEHDQPFGPRSQQSLSQLAFNRTATVEVRAHDDYGRTVGRVFVAGQSLDAEQVRRGMAWVYRHYATTQSLYTLEAEAKAARRGLWADPNHCRRGIGGMAKRQNRRPLFPATAPVGPNAAVEKWLRAMRRGFISTPAG